MLEHRAHSMAPAPTFSVLLFLGVFFSLVSFFLCISLLFSSVFCLFSREEHSMDQYRSRPKLSENFEQNWSIQMSGEIHMDQSLVHTFSWGNSYGPMVLKVLQKFPPTLVLVHGWLFCLFYRVSENSHGEKNPWYF